MALMTSLAGKMEVKISDLAELIISLSLVDKLVSGIQKYTSRRKKLAS